MGEAPAIGPQRTKVTQPFSTHQRHWQADKKSWLSSSKIVNGSGEKKKMYEFAEEERQHHLPNATTR